MRGTTVLALVAAGALLACQEPAPGPSTEDFSQSRAELAKRASKAPVAAARKKPAAAPAAEKAPEAATFASVEQGFSYDPAGKRDPFRSFEWERLAAVEDIQMRSPLERFDVSQLSLVAVVWETGRPRALVQDPAGQSYIIGRGSKIGKNQGRVIDIGDNSVRISETYVDLVGNEAKQDVELRIRRSQGG